MSFFQIQTRRFRWYGSLETKVVFEIGVPYFRREWDIRWFDGQWLFLFGVFLFTETITVRLDIIQMLFSITNRSLCIQFFEFFLCC